MKNIGAEIKKIMDAKSLKRRELAIFLDMTEANVSKIYGKFSIDSELLNRICQFIGTPISYFFEEGKGNATNIGNGNIAVSGNENFLGEPATPYGTKSEVNELKEKVQHLVELLAEKEKLITEKERLIKMLLKEEKLR